MLVETSKSKHPTGKIHNYELSEEGRLRGSNNQYGCIRYYPKRAWSARGIKGWSWDEVLPAYIALENHRLATPAGMAAMGASDSATHDGGTFA
jgi:hypothetical protein